MHLSFITFAILATSLVEAYPSALEATRRSAVGPSRLARRSIVQKSKVAIRRHSGKRLVSRAAHNVAIGARRLQGDALAARVQRVAKKRSYQESASTGQMSGESFGYSGKEKGDSNSSPSKETIKNADDGSDYPSDDTNASSSSPVGKDKDRGSGSGSSIDPSTGSTSKGQSSSSSGSQSGKDCADETGASAESSSTNDDPATSGTSSASAAKASTSGKSKATSSSAKSYQGEATYYTQNGNAGACGTVSQDDDKVVALYTSIYDNGSNCGKMVSITNSDGTTIEAKVMDECPSCSDDSHIDLSTGAFDALGSASQGVLPVTWSFIS